MFTGEGVVEMKRLIVLLVIAAGVLFFTETDADSAKVCRSDSDCPYRHVCVKQNPWSPIGHCIKGAR